MPETKTRLGVVEYVCFLLGSLVPAGEAAYLVTEEKDRATVVFSGISLRATATGNAIGAGNTINAAEEVIAAICDKERLDFRQCRFIDIQTGAQGTTPDINEVFLTKSGGVDRWGDSLRVNDLPNGAHQNLFDFIRGQFSEKKL